MTETARAILSYKGVLFKNHLLKGVTKGALTAEQVEAKFAAWEADKANKIQGKIDGLDKSADADKAARLKAEADANAAKAKAIEAKYTPEVEETPEEIVAEEAPVAEEVVAEEVVAEEVVAEEAPVVEEAPAAEEAASEETEAEA